MTVSPVSTESTRPGGLPERVAHTLSEQIIDGMLLPGAFLPTDNNPLLELIFQAVTGLMRASRKLTLSLSGASRALAGHQQIFAAVERGDAKAMRAMTRKHLHNVKEDLASQPATNLVFDEKELLG